MAEKKKILYIVEAMGGGVFTYIVDLANVLVVCFAPGADYEYTFSKWGQALLKLLMSPERRWHDGSITGAEA